MGLIRNSPITSSGDRADQIASLCRSLGRTGWDAADLEARLEQASDEQIALVLRRVASAPLNVTPEQMLNRCLSILSGPPAPSVSVGPSAPPAP